MILKIDANTELRLINKKHSHDFYQLIDKNRTYLRKWLGWLDKTTSVGDTESFLDFTLKEISEKTALCFFIWYNNSLAGIIDIHFTQKRGTIGYWIAKEYTGRKLAKKATEALANYVFKEFDIHRVEIKCATENKARQSIPESLNFQKEGILRGNEWLYDHYVDHIIYSALSTEWKS